MITFGPDGAYGHPDHIAISQLTTAAIVRPPIASVAVSKLYYIAWSERKWSAYQAALKKSDEHGRRHGAPGDAVARLEHHRPHRHERGLAARCGARCSVTRRR